MPIEVFMLFAYGGDVRDFMLNALDLNLINGEYAFICVDLIEDAHYGRNTWMGEDGRDGDAARAFNGLLNIHIKTPDVPNYDVFKAKVREKVAEEPFNRKMLPEEEVGWGLLWCCYNLTQTRSTQFLTCIATFVCLSDSQRHALPEVCQTLGLKCRCNHCFAV